MEHYDDDFYGLWRCLPSSPVRSKIGKYLLPSERTFYDALNDDFNLINNETFTALARRAEPRGECWKGKYLYAMNAMRSNICLSLNKQFLRS